MHPWFDVHRCSQRCLAEIRFCYICPHLLTSLILFITSYYMPLTGWVAAQADWPIQRFIRLYFTTFTFTHSTFGFSNLQFNGPHVQPCCIDVFMSVKMHVSRKKNDRQSIQCLWYYEFFTQGGEAWGVQYPTNTFTHVVSNATRKKVSFSLIYLFTFLKKIILFSNRLQNTPPTL